MPGLQGRAGVAGAAVERRSGLGDVLRRSLLLIRAPAKKRELWVARLLASRAHGECSRAILSFINPSKGANVVKTVCV